MHPSPLPYEGSRQNAARRRLTFILILALLGTLVVVLPSFANSHPLGAFEGGDANLRNDGTTDWNDFANVTPDSDGIRVVDGWRFKDMQDRWKPNDPNDDIYAGGVKQDDECPGIVPNSNGGAGNKNDLKRIYLADKAVGDDQMLALAWVRVPQNSTTASAHIALEFNQANPDDPETPGECDDDSDLLERTEGDLLMVYDFEGGQQPPNLKILRWLTTDGPSTAAACETAKSLPCWGDVDELALGTDFIAAVNHKDSNPDNSDPASPSVEDEIAGENLGTVEFGEALVDLTSAGIFEADECLSFGWVTGQSRSSGNSRQAQLKDVVGPEEFTISNCGNLTIEKETDPAESPAETDFDFTLETDETTFTLKHGGSKQLVVFEGTHTVTEDDPGPLYDLTDVECTTTNGSVDHIVDLETRSVDVFVAADQNVTCTFTNTLARGSLVVHKLDGEGEFLPGATFEARPLPSGTALPMIEGTGTVRVDDTPTQVDGVHCVDGLPLNDQFVIVETEAPPGYDLPAQVEATVTVTDVRPCAERRDDPDDEPDATFINVPQPGDVTIVKVDDDDNPVAGAIFELFEATKTTVGSETTYTVGESTGRQCRTFVGDHFVASTETTETLTGECYEFDGDDKPTTEGFQSLPLGSYCIEEVSTPEGYEAAPFDQDTHCFDIGVAAGGDSVSLTIENPRLHRIIVLVCHEGQSPNPVLHQSEVTLTTDSGPVAKSSLATGDADLCDLEGATFGGLGHDQFDLEVDTDTAH